MKPTLPLSGSPEKPARNSRYFSEDFRKARVKEIEDGSATVLEISRLHHVTRSSVYKWVEQYSLSYKKVIRTVVELDSETFKRKALEKKLDEVEKLLGQATVEIAFWRKLVDTAEEKYGIELKKK